jgi:hypothetical protein
VRGWAAIRDRTPRGGRFDAFALDIEDPCVTPEARRNRRLLALCERLRRRAGPRYPLGAIVPSPRGMHLRGRAYWSDFPFAGLRRTFDVFLAMTYFTFRLDGRRGRARDARRHPRFRLRRPRGRSDGRQPVRLADHHGADVAPAATRAYRASAGGVIGKFWLKTLPGS